MELGKVVEVSKQVGLDGIAITDHGTARGAFKARKLYGKELTIIPGEEVLTDRGEVQCLFLEEGIRGEEFFEVIEEAHSQGALCIASHPFDPFRLNRLRGLESLYGYLDGVEVFNSRCALERSNREAYQFARDKKMLMVAGSDAHTYGEIGGGGVEVERLEDIRKGRAAIFGTSRGIMELLKTKIYKTLSREV